MRTDIPETSAASYNVEYCNSSLVFGDNNLMSYSNYSLIVGNTNTLTNSNNSVILGGHNIYGDMSDTEKKKARTELEKYCGLDTEGMIWIVEKLNEIC